jgi:hypothetical protein
MRNPSGPADTLDRRDFLKTAGGLLLVTVTTACSDPSSPDSGKVVVTITGLTVAAPTGGHVTITGGALLTPLEFDLPAPTGAQTTVTHEASVKAGTYQVVYDRPAGYNFAAGSTGEFEVTIAPRETKGVNIALEAAPAAVGVYFHSDWKTGVGQADSAIEDHSNTPSWDDHGGSGFAQSGVETASSLSLAKWPTANAFVVRAFDDSPDRLASAQIWRDVGLPAAGAHRYYRMYVSMLWTDSHGGGTSGNTEHGIESASGATGGGAATGGHNFYMVPRADGTWWPGYRDQQLDERFIADNLIFAKNATYRVEWHLAYAATSYTIEFRIYDGDGVQVGQTSDFYRRTAGVEPNTKLSSFTFNNITLDRHRWFRVGCNGPGSNYPLANIVAGEPYRAHGAVAVSDLNWIGGYASGV